jgi:cell division protein FtsL
MHVHISALNGLIVALYVIVIIGALNLAAMKYADRSKLAASYANLMGLSA